MHFRFRTDGDHDIARVQYGQYNGKLIEPVGPPVSRAKTADVPHGLYRVLLSCPHPEPLADIGRTIQVANVVTLVTLR